MTALYDEDVRGERDEDESLERELFARRARALDLPALSVDDAVLRGQALREKTRRTRAVRWLGESARSVNGVVASLTVAAAALFFVVGGMRTSAMRVLAEPTTTSESPSPVGDRETRSTETQSSDPTGTSLAVMGFAPDAPELLGATSLRSASLACSTPAMSTLFSSVCEMPNSGALATRDGAHASDSADSVECSVSRDDLACESSPCGRDVTCSRKMP